MENKKKLNLILSLLIILSVGICLSTILSIGAITIFLNVPHYQEEIGSWWTAKIAWRCGAPIIVFGAIAALLSIIKMFTCSILLLKSSNKEYGVISVICDALVVIGFILVIVSFAVWHGNFYDSKGGMDKMDHLGKDIQSLLLVGIPTMFVASIASFGINRKVA